MLHREVQGEALTGETDGPAIEPHNQGFGMPMLLRVQNDLHGTGLSVHGTGQPAFCGWVEVSSQQVPETHDRGLRGLMHSASGVRTDASVWFRKALLPWPDFPGKTSSATDECAAWFPACRVYGPGIGHDPGTVALLWHRYPVGRHADDIRALYCQQPICLGEPAVVADDHSQSAKRHIEQG